MKKEILDKVKVICENCTSCCLYRTRNNVVFADGNPETAKIVLIGEAPGENEDLQGKPFVGRAGKLLNEFLISANIDREKDLYIINTVKCRPPKNRVPSDTEKKACREFLEAQIDVIKPNIIILCGATALKSFINEKKPISKIRGELFDVSVKNDTYKAMPIFHPSYLLRNHSLEENKPRSLTLNDLKKAKSFV